MPEAKDVYVNCDILDEIPSENKLNWNEEVDLLCKMLPHAANVLQVGSMDATRIISLLKVRPDLSLTGIEIDEEIHKLAVLNVRKAAVSVGLVLGDITAPPNLPEFDYVICLNNTLGYIPDQEKAIENMKKLGKKVVISVYGEKFTDELAARYFRSINLELLYVKEDIFELKDFGSVRRYGRSVIDSWGCEVVDTRVGYFCVFG